MEKLKISSGARLNKVLSTLMICMALMMNVSYLSAQNPNVTVTGTVEDTMGPVIGASVVEKGVPSAGNKFCGLQNSRNSFEGTENSESDVARGH